MQNRVFTSGVCGRIHYFRNPVLEKNRMHRTLALTIATIAVSAATAQVPPEFEAASLKINRSMGGQSTTKLSKGGLILGNKTVKQCIALAYGLPEDKDYAISGPKWMADDRYDVEAKFPPESRIEQVRAMFRMFLADRFELTAHRETREVPVYALVVARNSGKLQASTVETPSFTRTPGHYAARGMTMQGLVDRFGQAFQLGIPILDFTGLAGKCDADLDWDANDLGSTTGESTKSDPGNAPSVFTALQEQLGLKLEPRKAPVEVLVVDRIARTPKEN